MRILLDQGTPVPLRAALPGHEILTVLERHWTGLKNDALLNNAEAEGFAAIITPDQNLRHQQVVTGRRIAILVLLTMDWRLIHRHLPYISRAVSKLVAGSYTELPFPPPA